MDPSGAVGSGAWIRLDLCQIKAPASVENSPVYSQAVASCRLRALAQSGDCEFRFIDEVA